MSFVCIFWESVLPVANFEVVVLTLSCLLVMTLRDIRSALFGIGYSNGLVLSIFFLNKLLVVVVAIL